MPLSLHIVRGNARRVTGKKRSSKATAPDQCVMSALRLGLITQTRSAVTNLRERAGRRITIFRRLTKQPITESPTMRSFLCKDTTPSVVFKVIRRSRRAQLWNRQASIIMNLTTLAHGGRCLPRI